MVESDADELQRSDLEDVIETANQNTHNALKVDQALMDRFKQIHQAYMLAIDSIGSAQPIQCGFFLPRAHAAFIAAVRLGTAGEIPESYAISRLVLEHGLYAYFVRADIERAKRWINRDSSDASRKAMRAEFLMKKIQQELLTNEARLGKMVQELYDRTISFGAHPNPLGMFAAVEHTEQPGAHYFKTLYLCSDNTVLSAGLRTAAQVGVAVLEIFQLIYLTRFQLADLPAKIEALKPGL